MSAFGQNSRRTEQSYTNWIRRFVNFYHNPHGIGLPEVEAFLTDLAVNGKVSAATPGFISIAVSLQGRSRDGRTVDGWHGARKSIHQDTDGAVRQ